MASVNSVNPNFDEDELRARAMQGMGETYPPMPLAPVLAPPGLSPHSSIEPVDRKVEIPQHRPSLPPPSPNPMYNLLAMQNEIERLTQRNAEQFELDVNRSLADIEKLSAEKDEAIKTEAEAIKSRATWSALSTIAEYITGVAAIILGTAVFSVAAIPGALIIAAGAVGTANRVLHDTHILHAFVEWSTKSAELQKKYIDFFETSAFFLQMGLGLAGGIGAWKVGAFAAMNAASGTDVVQKIASVITPASSVVIAGARVGTKFYEKRIADASAQTKELDCAMTSNNQYMTQETSKMSRRIEETESGIEIIRKAINNLVGSQD